MQKLWCPDKITLYVSLFLCRINRKGTQTVRLSRKTSSKKKKKESLVCVCYYWLFWWWKSLSLTACKLWNNCFAFILCQVQSLLPQMRGKYPEEDSSCPPRRFCLVMPRLFWIWLNQKGTNYFPWYADHFVYCFILLQLWYKCSDLHIRSCANHVCFMPVTSNYIETFIVYKLIAFIKFYNLAIAVCQHQYCCYYF